MADLRLDELAKTYPSGVTAVDRVSLHVREGELVVLVGPSGCGKTTLLRLIAGLEEATGGRILLGERDVTATPPGRRNVAMVFQNYALYPFKTVYDNLAFGLRMRRLPAKEVDRLVRAAAAQLGLHELLASYPAKLSGGQQQRVALGRALVRRADLFLFDEPLSNLDANLRRDTRQEIKRLQREVATAAVYVTHDQEEAMSVGDRLVVMRGGHLLQVGTPQEVYARPASRFVAGFFGSPPMNFLEGSLAERDGTVAWESAVAPPLPLGPARSAKLRPHVGERVTLGFRPEALRGGPPGASALTLKLRVSLFESLGEYTDVSLRTERGDRLIARARGGCPAREGDVLEMHVSPDACYLFAAGPEGASLDG